MHNRVWNKQTEACQTSDVANFRASLFPVSDYAHLHAHGAAVVEVDLEASGVGSGPLHGVGAERTTNEKRAANTMA